MDGKHTHDVPTSSLSSAAQELLGKIADARFPREARVGRMLARAMAGRLVTPDECRLVADAAAKRWHELNANYAPTQAWARLDDDTGSVPVADRPWTPTAILDSLPRQRSGEADELDARERQLPNGDRL